MLLHMPLGEPHTMIDYQRYVTEPQTVLRNGLEKQHLSKIDQSNPFTEN